jgi:hypothetical protein
MWNRVRKLPDAMREEGVELRISLFADKVE